MLSRRVRATDPKVTARVRASPKVPPPVTANYQQYVEISAIKLTDKNKVSGLPARQIMCQTGIGIRFEVCSLHVKTRVSILRRGGMCGAPIAHYVSCEKVLQDVIFITTQAASAHL